MALSDLYIESVLTDILSRLRSVVKRLDRLEGVDSREEGYCHNCKHAEDFRGCIQCLAIPKLTILPQNAKCPFALWSLREDADGDKEVSI